MFNCVVTPGKKVKSRVEPPSMWNNQEIREGSKGQLKYLQLSINSWILSYFDSYVNTMHSLPIHIFELLDQR